MAPFNVSPGQPNDPNFLKYPEVIEGPHLLGATADQSGSQRIAATGTAISDITGLVDTDIKKNIQDEVYKSVDKERDSFTAGLQKVKSDLDNGLIAPAVRGGVATPGGTTGNSLIMDASNDEPEVPEGLASGLSRIQQMSAAKAAGSPKINDTSYSANVLSIAKQLRAQYGTGYREMIDDTVSKASGLPVANSYYQNLMLDINRQLTQLGKAKDDVGAQMVWGMHEGVPNMAVFMDQRKNNDPKYPGDAAMLKKINDFTTLKATIQIQAQQRAETKDNKADQVENEKSNLTKNANNLIYHHIEDNLQLSGMNDFRSLMNFMSEATAGTRKVSDTEVQARVPELAAYRAHIEQEVRKMAIGPASVIGSDEAEKIVQRSLAPIDTFINLANNKETGAAYFHLRQNQAIKEDETNNWLVSKDKGAAARQFMTARGLLGDIYFPQYMAQAAAAGADKPFAGVLTQEALAAVAPVYDMRGEPIQRTIGDAISHAKKVGVTDIENYVGKVTGWLEQMNDPNMPLAAKDNMVRWAFSKPGVTDELKMEYRDPNTGKIVPGKYRALNLIASDRNVQSIAETAKIHPENYQMLKSWTETEFGKLFRSDLQNLNNTMQMPGMNLHFGYDDTTKQFMLVDKNNRPVVRPPKASGDANTDVRNDFVNNAMDTIDRVNSGTQRIRSVYLHNPNGDKGGSVDRYILQTLQTAGFRPGEEISGAPAEMAKALVKTLKPEATSDQINKLILGK